MTNQSHLVNSHVLLCATLKAQRSSSRLIHCFVQLRLQTVLIAQLLKRTLLLTLPWSNPFADFPSPSCSSLTRCRSYLPSTNQILRSLSAILSCLMRHPKCPRIAQTPHCNHQLSTLVCYLRVCRPKPWLGFLAEILTWSLIWKTNCSYRRYFLKCSLQCLDSPL